MTDVIGGLILGGISLIFLELILKGKIYFLNKIELKYQGLLYLSLLLDLHIINLLLILLLNLLVEITPH